MYEHVLNCRCHSPVIDLRIAFVQSGSLQKRPKVPRHGFRAKKLQQFSQCYSDIHRQMLLGSRQTNATST